MTALANLPELPESQPRSRISELRDMVRVIVTAALTPPSAKGE